MYKGIQEIFAKENTSAYPDQLRARLMTKIKCLSLTEKTNHALKCVVEDARVAHERGNSCTAL